MYAGNGLFGNMDSAFHVTFEPACRNNLHIHHTKSGGGQMLIDAGGRGMIRNRARRQESFNLATC